ncbi:MAG: RnfABCDGE type electron transport complex subunit G [Deltaproteobacteria bacterium]|nr:RnfABCDGE type electron transport complex subunit G [Deltaproteobacteria bacterium]
MREIIKMFVVLTVLSASAGGLLAALEKGTKDRIESQELEFVKGPAINSILDGASNDPIADRFKITDGAVEQSFFVGRFDGKANAVVFEGTGKGFGGELGLMIGVNVDDDKILGVGVTTHSETPGLGATAKDDPAFVSQFKDASIADSFKVTSDGGKVNAMSGATITSRGVCAGVTNSGTLYQKLKPQIAEKLKELNK